MRILAIDYGDRRIGLAVSDETATLCGEAFTLEEWDMEKAAERIAVEARRRGAGEILLTSMDCDGQKNGYDLALTSAVSGSVSIPVIASGGAGKPEHFYEAFTKGRADAVLAASLFHFGEITIPELKQYLSRREIPVRL
jgi:cyclase